MKRRTGVILGGIGILVVGGAVAAFARDGGGDATAGTVVVQKGDIVDKALAVGEITPDVEVEVKSQLAGVVKKIYADEGDHVRAGAPLLEIRPNPTPLELVEARRQLQIRQVDLDRAQKEYDRLKPLREQEYVTQEEFDGAEQKLQEARLQSQLARERLALLEKGKVQSSGGDVETVVRAPIDGIVLTKTVEIGDPVVPLTSYQEGTAVMTMASMSSLLFKGTVDEIDVGRLKEGMRADIKIGALPDAHVTGTLTKISPKGKKQENATVFPVEISLDSASAARLRAGYSANAEIIVDRRTDVLTIPERVVTFEGDSSWVTVQLAGEKTEKRTIRTGLSDAVNLEVVSGLSEGDRVREKPTREIE
ncbi:MAG TPA: efflux RND transporter periplasmic adaptor subunit [Gemmatimonadota bacterium]|nr:efflux RND transporter periplasmic adaptor subunit [Gemmatimonadota bacterium]